MKIETPLKRLQKLDFNGSCAMTSGQVLSGQGPSFQISSFRISSFQVFGRNVVDMVPMGIRRAIVSPKFVERGMDALGE